ncbi:MAG TPA: serine hydrolase domain-containing protein [Bacteroidia bacterium]|jgi:CubicO group peptidase (beta-lactamase class C family)|nr:serine hydrolase domain-containing protein [Bacteroidia bacterium]
MKKNILVALFGILSLCSNAQKYSKEVLEKIKETEHNLATWVQIEGTTNWSLEERMKFYKAKGVSIAVIKNYKVEWAKAYGWADSAEKRPATVQTLFQAASNSKSLNSLAVLKLMEEGKLKLDTDINVYLKSWQFPYDSLSKGEKIIIANLLNHTGGLSTAGFPGYSKKDTLPSLLQILNGKRPANSPPVKSLFEPGLKFQYSGGGVEISQLMIQDITGLPYAEYMQKNILQPLGMNQSFFTQPPPAEKAKQMASGYYGDGKQVPEKYKIYPEMAAAGLWTNPSDLAKYVIETQLSLQGKSNKIISKAATKLRLTPFIDSAATLGVFVTNRSGVKYFMHGGGNEGFVSQYVGSLENGNGVVVMINNNNSGLLDEIINSVAITYRWPNFYQPAIKKEIKINADSLETFTGIYKAGNTTFEMVKKDGALWMNLGGTLYKTHFTDDINFFIYESIRIYFKFLYTKDHRVGGFSINEKGIAKKLEIKK